MMSAPPSKKVCYDKEYLNSENSKHIVRPFNLSQQHSSKNRTKITDGNVQPKLLKIISTNGKDLGDFKVKMISKNSMQIGKATMVPKLVSASPKSEKDDPAKIPKSETEDVKPNLQTQYTTKARYLPKTELTVNSAGQKQITCRRPLILKKTIKSVNKVQAESPLQTQAEPSSKVKAEPSSKVQAEPSSKVQAEPSRFQYIKVAKPTSNDVKPVALVGKPEKVPEKTRVINSYMRILKKIGPNKQLIPCDSPDAKTIINTVTESINKNGTIKFVQKSVPNTAPPTNGYPMMTDPLFMNRGASNDASLNLMIIEQALISLTDCRLRERALRALTEYKISNHKQVPAFPHRKVKLTRDAMIQTDGSIMTVRGKIVVTSNNGGKIKKQKLQEKVQSSVSHSNKEDDKNLFRSALDKVLVNFGQANDSIESVLNRGKMDLPSKKLIDHLYRDYKLMRNFDGEGMLGLHQAVVANDVKGVNRFLLLIKITIGKLDFDVDVKTQDASTSLELAIESDASEEIIRALLKAGAKPYSSDATHNSAIILASKKQSPYFTLLLEYTDKSFIDSTDLDGFTCLHYCAQNGNLEIARMLLLSGADVNFQDKKSGRTALFIAIENKQEDIIKLLLDYNADPNVQNFSGQNILPFIESIKSYDLKSVLQKVFR